MNTNDDVQDMGRKIRDCVAIMNDNQLVVMWASYELVDVESAVEIAEAAAWRRVNRRLERAKGDADA